MASEWYYSQSGERQGPVTSDQLKDLVASGRIKPDDLVWKDGMGEWEQAGKKLKNLFQVGVAAAAGPPPIRSAARDLDGGPPPAFDKQEVANKKMAAGICGILVGSLGIHKFILNMTTPGLIMLLVTLLTCGAGGLVMWVIGLVEGIMYLTKSDEEFYQTYIVEKKAWF